jgi:hypothetical protein
VRLNSVLNTLRPSDFRGTAPMERLPSLPSQDSPIGVWFNRGADYARELQVVSWRAMHLVERIG